MHTAFISYTCDMTESDVWHDRIISVMDMTVMTTDAAIYGWIMHAAFIACVCDMTESYVWHDWIMSVMYMTYMRTGDTWYDSIICVIWLNHKCDAILHDKHEDRRHVTLSHSYMCHDVLQISKDSTRSGCETRAVAGARIRTCCLSGLIHMFAMTLSHVFHDTFIRVPWFIHMCERARARILSLAACQVRFTCLSWLFHMGAITHSHVCHDVFIRASMCVLDSELAVC